jgi:hypothetical protein
MVVTVTTDGRGIASDCAAALLLVRDPCPKRSEDRPFGFIPAKHRRNTEPLAFF